jgi:hypothetical protein
MFDSSAGYAANENEKGTAVAFVSLLSHVGFARQICACPFVCPQRSIRCADAIQNGTSCPFEKVGFSQALFFPKQHAGEFRPLRRATRALPSTCQLLKKLDQNYNPVRAGCVIINP